MKKATRTTAKRKPAVVARSKAFPLAVRAHNSPAVLYPDAISATAFTFCRSAFQRVTGIDVGADSYANECALNRQAPYYAVLTLYDRKPAVVARRRTTRRRMA